MNNRYKINAIYSFNFILFFFIIGYQRKPAGKVKEILDMPDAHSFEMKYVKQSRPVVIREALKDLPVFNTWKEDKYLKDK